MIDVQDTRFSKSYITHLMGNLGIGESAPRWLDVVIKKHNHKQDFWFLTSHFHLFIVHFDSFGSWSREVEVVKGGGWIKRGRLLVPPPSPPTLPPWTSVHPKTRACTRHYLLRWDCNLVASSDRVSRYSEGRFPISTRTLLAEALLTSVPPARSLTTRSPPTRVSRHLV